MSQNCWEFKRCGRAPGGSRVQELGICPASLDTSCDGLNGGKNGGRICWAIAGTLCDGEVQGTFVGKQFNCISCDFFQKVRAEIRQKEGPGKFHVLKPDQKNLLRSLMIKEMAEN